MRLPKPGGMDEGVAQAAADGARTVQVVVRSLRIVRTHTLASPECGGCFLVLAAGREFIAGIGSLAVDEALWVELFEIN